MSRIRSMLTGRVGVLSVLFLLAGACASDGDASPDPAASATTEPTSTTTASTTTSTTTTTIATPPPIPPDPPEGFELVWHDEFDGDTIDRSNWTFDIGGWGFKLGWYG